MLFTLLRTPYIVLKLIMLEKTATDPLDFKRLQLTEIEHYSLVLTIAVNA